jgi:hypothetical protein
MSEEIKQRGNNNPAEFKQGVATGLSSAEDTRNPQATNELGQELKDEGEKKEPVNEGLAVEGSTPLFMKDSSEGNKGNAQDEKDETEE